MEEDHSHGDYAEFMSEFSQSLVEKVNEVEELQNTKASSSASLTKLKKKLASAVTSAAETAKVISSFHQSCDWLLQIFDTRKTARAGVVEALNNARAVLLDRTIHCEKFHSESFSLNCFIFHCAADPPRVIRRSCSPSTG